MLLVENWVLSFGASAHKLKGIGHSGQALTFFHYHLYFTNHKVHEVPSAVDFMHD